MDGHGVVGRTGKTNSGYASARTVAALVKLCTVENEVKGKLVLS